MSVCCRFEYVSVKVNREGFYTRYFAENLMYIFFFLFLRLGLVWFVKFIQEKKTGVTEDGGGMGDVSPPGHGMNRKQQ